MGSAVERMSRIRGEKSEVCSTRNGTDLGKWSGVMIVPSGGYEKE